MADWEYRNIELNDPRREVTELDLLGKTEEAGSSSSLPSTASPESADEKTTLKAEPKPLSLTRTTNRRLPNEKVECLPVGPVRRRSQSVRQSRPHEPRSAGLIPRCEEFRYARQSQNGAKEGEVPACAHLPRGPHAAAQ